MKAQTYFINNTNIRIKENSLIARLAAAKLRSHRVAIVLGKTVHLFNSTAEDFLKSERWLHHEMTHISQFKQYGLLRFVFLYLWESIKHGYYKNKFEVEARLSDSPKNNHT